MIKSGSVISHYPAPKTKLIYNPNAGQKRRWFHPVNSVSLEEIKSLLEQYQFVVDYAPTKQPGHATELATQAAKDGYKLVIAAGGDGTISEVANGLIGTNAILGIIPLGSFMNTARMLAIPFEIESAIHILKIGRVRKIDVGVITSFENRKLATPEYFLESAGLGIEAEFHRQFLDFERGQPLALWRIIKLLYQYTRDLAVIKISDKKIIRTRATMVTISNAPITGAALPIAPLAKLNDHRLTLSLYRMTKWQIMKYFLFKTPNHQRKSRKIEVLQVKKLRVDSKIPKLVHADARVYGQTPVEFEILPNALNVITGFPKAGQSALLKRTLLDA